MRPRKEIIERLDGSRTEIRWRARESDDLSRSRIRKEKDRNGNTVEVWHEVFDEQGKLIHKDWKGPGPKPTWAEEIP